MYRSFTCVLLLLIGLGDTSYADEPKAEVAVKAPLYGRIVDSDGKPVTDAKLSLQGPKYYRSQTGDDGRYDFTDVAEAGEYRIRIESKQCVGLTNYRTLPRVAIDPDEALERDFTLERACQVKIVVVDEDDKPVRASVYCKSTAADDFSGSSNRQSTNREGVAIIGGMKKSNAKYIIGVQSKTHAFAHVMVSAKDPDEVPEHKLILKVGKTVKGKAVCSDGLPPAGWKISALPTWWNFGSYPSGTVIADDGSFELKHVGDDQYNVSISIPLGEGMSTMRNVLSGASLSTMKQPIACKMDYPSPKSMSYLDVRIRWIGKPLDRGINISGYSATRQHISHYLGSGKKTAKIGPIPPGTYRISVGSSEVEVMNLRKIKNLDDLEHVKIPNEKPLQIVLRARGKPHVQGTVVDAETKQPIKSFQYRVTKYRTLSGPNYVQVDDWKFAKSEKGEFEMDVVGPGVYVVSVLADGYAITSSKQVNTDESPDEMLSVELKPGITVRGKVVDQDGKPINGAKVRARSLASGSMPRVSGRFVTETGATKTEQGQFEIPNLAEGADAIRVDHPDYVFRETPIDVTEEGALVTITMTDGATIRGKVFDSDGKPAASKTLFFHDNYAYGGRDREAGELGTATTDDDGNYVVKHIPEMTVYISRTNEWRENAMVRHAVHAKDGQTHAVNFGGTSRMHGRYFANGKPLSGARLQLGGTDSTFGAMKMYTKTNDNGEFSFYGAPPGHWTLYRQFDQQRGEWTKVREVDVPADGNLDVGEISQKIGFLKVQCTTNADALPEHLTLQIQDYSENLFGRDAALVLPNENPDDPFIIEQVAPGDYHVITKGFGDCRIYHRIKVTDEIINTTIPFAIPKGKGTVKAKVIASDGKPANHYLVMWSEDKRLVFYMKDDADEKTAATSIATNVPDGKYVIRNGNRGDARIVGRVEVVDGDSQTVEITVEDNDDETTGVINIVTMNEEGVVLPCTIEVLGKTSKEIFQSHRDTKTTLRGPKGKVEIELKHPGFKPVKKTIELESFKSQASMTIVMKEG